MRGIEGFRVDGCAYRDPGHARDALDARDVKRVARQQREMVREQSAIRARCEMIGRGSVMAVVSSGSGGLMLAVLVGERD